MNVTKVNIRILLAMLMSSLLVFTSCDDDDDDNTPSVDADIVEIASSDARFSVLVSALTEAGLVTTLQGSGPFTVFAPNDEAFSDFLTDNGFNTLADIPNETLEAVLVNHVVQGNFRSTDLPTEGYLQSLLAGGGTTNPVSIYVDQTGGVTLNGVSTVSEANIEASNGVIHEVDQVIPLPTVVDHVSYLNDLSVLVDALSVDSLSTDLIAALSGEGPFTVFAPTNEAFVALLDSNPDWNTLEDIPVATLEAVLTYHVIPGQNILSTDISDGLAVNTLSNDAALTFFVSADGIDIQDNQGGTSSVTGGNIQATNGVVHVINRVLLP